MNRIERARANYSIPGEYTAMALRSFSAALDLAEALLNFNETSDADWPDGTWQYIYADTEAYATLNATIAAFLATLPEEG